LRHYIYLRMVPNEKINVFTNYCYKFTLKH